MGKDTREQEALIEIILRITGGGRVDIDRKNKTVWHGQLKTRLLFISNVMPTLLD